MCGLVCTLHEILVTVCNNCDFTQVDVAAIHYMVVKICDFAVHNCLLLGILHFTVVCAFEVNNLNILWVLLDLLYLQKIKAEGCLLLGT